MSNGKKSGFGGIFRKLGEMAMTPEYLEELKKNQPPVQETPSVEVPAENKEDIKTVFATPSATYIPSGPSQTEIQKTVEKIHKFLESINKPGVDFLEFWNAVLAMEGGVTTANIKNAFVAIKMMSGNSVTKDILVSTGNDYIIGLTTAIEQDIQKKTKDKEKLQSDLTLEKTSLEGEVSNLEQQIKTLSTELGQKKMALAQIDSKYSPKMQDADNSIVSGTAALNVVVNEIKNFIALIQQTIQ